MPNVIITLCVPFGSVPIGTYFTQLEKEPDPADRRRRRWIERTYRKTAQGSIAGWGTPLQSPSLPSRRFDSRHTVRVDASDLRLLVHIAQHSNQ